MDILSEGRSDSGSRKLERLLLSAKTVTGFSARQIKSKKIPAPKEKQTVKLPFWMKVIQDIHLS